MRFGPHACLLVLGLLAACGEDVPPAHYEVFTLELVDLAEGERVVPGTSLAYRTRYVGDLARNLQFTAVLTHEASGETATVRWSEPPQDTASIDFLRRWTLRHEFLKKSGPIRVQLRASLTATQKGSTPWGVESESVYVELYPTLDGLEVKLPAAGQPVAYGTPVEVRVTGKDLWGDVAISVVDVDAGNRVAELDKVLPFDGSQSSLASTWPLRARELERIGTHPLRLVARYGDLQQDEFDNKTSSIHSTSTRTRPSTTSRSRWRTSAAPPESSGCTERAERHMAVLWGLTYRSSTPSDRGRPMPGQVKRLRMGRGCRPPSSSPLSVVHEAAMAEMRAQGIETRLCCHPLGNRLRVAAEGFRLAVLSVSDGKRGADG